MAHLDIVRHRPAAIVAVLVAEERDRRAIVAGLLVTAGMVALLAVSQAIDFGAFDLRIWAFNADKRYSVFGVVSVLAQAAVAAACAWRAPYVERSRWGWFALATLVGGLVIVRGLSSYDGKTLAMPLACILGLLIVLTWRDPRASRVVVLVALVLLAMSLMLHEVGPDADASTASDFTWEYQITGIVKHGCELGGWMLIGTGIIAGATARLASSRGGRA